jgi:hypothetical protein
MIVGGMSCAIRYFKYHFSTTWDFWILIRLSFVHTYRPTTDMIPDIKTLFLFFCRSALQIICGFCLALQ